VSDKSKCVQVVSGDGGAFFASATGKGLTCYGVINGATTEYAAKPDINGLLTCSQAQQRLAGLGAGVWDGLAGEGLELYSGHSGPLLACACGVP